MRFDFRKKVALITGAGSGIGEALAYGFAREGADVILTGRRADRLQEVARRCEGSGVRTWVFPADLADREAVRYLAEQVRSQALVPDFYVLNAGISQRAKALDSDFEVDVALMQVNYFGAVGLVKAFRPEILAAPRVSIAVTTSISGIFGFPLRSAYCASKRALYGFFESLELENPHIRVTFLTPGRINTEISRSALTAHGEAYAKMDEGQASGMPAGRCAEIALRAIARGRHHRLIGGKELFMVYIYKYIPGLYYRLARKVSAT